jgi:hypothetical protein
VRLDPTALRPYAGAVHAATDANVAGLPACLLGALLLTLAMRRGEIACLARGHRPAVDGTEA